MVLLLENSPTLPGRKAVYVRVFRSPRDSENMEDGLEGIYVLPNSALEYDTAIKKGDIDHSVLTQRVGPSAPEKAHFSTICIIKIRASSIAGQNVSTLAEKVLQNIHQNNVHRGHLGTGFSGHGEEVGLGFRFHFMHFCRV